MKFVKPTMLSHLLGRKTSNRHRHGLLGLHVGDKYVSLAMSDKESKTAVPLEFMNREEFGIDLIADSMQNHISNFNLGGCIVGYRSIRSIEKSDIFIDNLCKMIKLEGLKYAYWDGMIISKDVGLVLKHHAEYLVDQLSLPQETLKTILDKFAAVRTLQMKFLQPLNLFKESLKREALKRNQLLGLNVGDRFLSLALSDPENITAVPLRVWPTVLYDKASVADTIQTLIPKHNLMGLVVFSPNISSKSCPMYSYIGSLHKTGKLEGLMYTCWDEKFSSKRVEFLSNHHVEFIKSLSLPKHLSEKCIEQLAAWHMLQGYLDYSNMLVAIDKDDADLFGGN